MEELSAACCNSTGDLRGWSAMPMNRVFVLVAGFLISSAALGAAPQRAGAAESNVTQPVSSAPTFRRAQDFYRQLRIGALDRSKLDAPVNAALTPELAKVLSGQLTALGDPSWEYVGPVTTERGAVDVYRIVTRQVALRMSFGLTRAGKVWDFVLTPER